MTMSDKTFTLEIITPDRVVFAGSVTEVKAPGLTGSFGVLANHTPYLTVLQIGEITVHTDSQVISFASSEGYAEVANNKMSILVRSAERSDQIDLERAKRARDRALKRIKARQARFGMQAFGGCRQTLQQGTGPRPVNLGPMHPHRRWPTSSPRAAAGADLISGVSRLLELRKACDSFQGRSSCAFW